MGLRINHNISSLNAHRNLTNADRAASKSMEKLSSGLKINRAADGPAALVVSETMRAQVAGLNQAVDNSETAVTMVQTAEAALNEVNNLLTGMRQLAIHASNDGANDEIMLAADQAEIANAIETVDRISQNTQFGTKKLLDGSRGANGITSGDHLEFIDATPNTKSSPVSGYDIKLSQVATQSSITSGALTQEKLDKGERLTIVESGKTMEFVTKKGESIETVVDNLNINFKQNGLELSAEKTVQMEKDADGNPTGKKEEKVTIKHNDFGSDPKFLVTSETAGVFSKEANVTIQSDVGKNVQGTINGQQTIGSGENLTGREGTAIEGLSVRYSGREQIEAGAEKNVGTVTVAQNSLTFHVGANEGQTVSLSVKGIGSDSVGKGVVNDSNFGSLQEIDVTTFQGAQDGLKVIDKAINEISTTRAGLGAFQKNTLESNLVNLKVAAENLTNAESVLRDADMASEMANFTKNQVMQKAGTAMLAQANQSSQQVLSLIS
ncbi:MAG: flagellin [bacterium]|jgi:flagellin